MAEKIIEDQTFDKQDFTIRPLPKGEYEHCRFIGCEFSNADIKDVRFLECVFEGCNLSMAKFNGTALIDIQFINCKMLGLQFAACSQFGLAVRFDGCILNHSSFYQTKLKKTLFKNTLLLEVDFTQCDVSNAIFDNCDFSGALFENTILEKADLRTSFNYTINPENNRLKKAKFSLSGLAGLLRKYDIDIDMRG